MLGGTQQIPGLIFVLIADPCGECSINPASGGQSRQYGGIPSACGPNIVAVGRGTDHWMLFEYLIEIIEKIIAVVRVIFPRIFAIEYHAYNRVFSGYCIA